MNSLIGFDPAAVAEIRARLDAVRDQGVKIGFAIESGSRAWGFPSPDSDYDCRFVYIRPISHHLTLFPHRDVIEFPIVGDIDTGGWDLRKALLLGLKGNAVLVEWATSPLVYEEVDGFRSALLALLEEIMWPVDVAYHYIGLLKRNAGEQPPESMKLKKLLYGIRPAVALEWMRQRNFTALPPMNMIACMEQTELTADARSAILELIEVKKHTKEMGEGPVPVAIKTFLSTVAARVVDPHHAVRDKDRFDHAKHLADRFYRQEVLQLDDDRGKG